MPYVRIALLTALALALGASYYQVDAWPNIHGDARNTDTSPATGFEEFTVAWSRDFPGNIAAAATIDNQGQVYFTTNDETAGACHLYAIELDTGNDVWCTDEVNRWAVGSSALIDSDGNIYVGDDEAMHSFDRDGNLRWDTATVGAAISAQLLDNGHLIFVTHIGQIMVLDRSDGQMVVPTYELLPGETYTQGTGLGDCLFGGTACPSANTLSVDLPTGRFYNTLRPPGEAETEIHALQYHYATDHISPLWVNDTLEGGTASSPVISADGTRIYVNDNGGNFLALDAVTGAEIWDVDIGYSPGGSPSVTDGGRGMPAGGASSQLLAVQDNGATGSISWSRPGVVNLGIPVQASGDVAYAFVRQPGTFLGVDFISVNATTGAETERITMTPSPVFTTGTSVAADSTVVVVGITGVVAAFNPVGC